MNIEAIFIDAGGIIIDETNYEESCAEHITKTINSFGIQYTISDYWRDYKEGIVAFCPQSRQYVIWKVANYNIKKYNEIWDKFIEEWTRPPLELMPEIKNVLLNLSNDYTLILAGQYGKEVFELLRYNGINCFVNSLSQDDFKITKPDCRYIEQIAQRSNIDPQSAIMVGDRIDNDIIPATQLGMKSIFVKSSIYKIQQPRIPQENPTKTINSISEIPDTLKKIQITY